MIERCLNCKEKIYYNLDSYGKTPFHLHCNNCNINIGATSIKKCESLFKQYTEPNTYIEYYNNNIQLYVLNNKIKINKEKI